MDGSALPDQIVYTPGDHTFTVIAGKEIYSKKISVSYSVKDTLIKKDARGYTEDGKAVFDAAFAAVDQVVNLSKNRSYNDRFAKSKSHS